MDGEGTGDREMVVLIRIRSILTSSFHQLIHILGNFIIGHFGIALRGPDVRVSHHFADTLNRHTCRKRQGPERMPARVVAEILFHTGQYAYLSTKACSDWAEGIPACRHRLYCTRTISARLRGVTV